MTEDEVAVRLEGFREGWAACEKAIVAHLRAAAEKAHVDTAQKLRSIARELAESLKERNK